MSIAERNTMNVDEFLGWLRVRDGRWELIEGEVIGKTPERPAHTQTKLEAVEAMKGAIRRAGAPYHVMYDTGIVRTSSDTAFEPDALVYRGPRLSPEALEVSQPVIVIEVLSDATAARDHGLKLSGYFSVPSVAHYLILDPARRAVTHHERGEDGAIKARILTEGPLRLDPPGLAFFVEELFSPA